MKVCFIVSQIFAWGKYGGFGSLTRTIGGELVNRGIEVSAVVPRREDQKPVEYLEGIKVYGYNPAFFMLDRKPYKMCDADIYHSEEPTFSSYLAMKAMPDRKHIVTSQDPRDKHDWEIEHQYTSPQRRLLFPISYLYENSYFSKNAVQMADAVCCAAKFASQKVKRLYNLDYEPSFLPNPVIVHSRNLNKAKEPTVCYIARWDRRKRPEIFFELAKKFPKIKFIAPGNEHDKKRDTFLRQKYSKVPNLELPGFVSADKRDKILEESWIMINTAARECLPAAFLEAAAHKCAILSGVKPDPDDFAKNFGHHVQDDNFTAGLQFLLENNRWKQLGEKGYAYVKKTHELSIVVDKHIKMYKSLIS